MKDRDEFSSFSFLTVLVSGSGSHWLAINRGWGPKTPLSYRQKGFISQCVILYRTRCRFLKNVVRKCTCVLNVSDNGERVSGNSRRDVPKEQHSLVIGVFSNRGKKNYRRGRDEKSVWRGTKPYQEGGWSWMYRGGVRGWISTLPWRVMNGPLRSTVVDCSSRFVKKEKPLGKYF